MTTAATLAMSSTTSAATLHHESVLLSEAVTGLMLTPSDTVVDATVGGAGHFTALLSGLDARGTLIGIDADEAALTRARERIGDTDATVHLVRDNFRNLGAVLDRLSVRAVQKSLFDLGWSGYQLGEGRGFSFKGSEPLLMTYGEAGTGESAADALNTLSEEDLANIIFEYGEEQYARRIAHGIVLARKQSPIVTTDELVSVIEASTPRAYHHRRIHPATKTFQALRVYVNDELGAMREGLSAALSRTSNGGRIAVITFHSLEDRIVKNLFKDAAREGKGVVLTKKPIVPSTEECARNPRARSAKLRIFEVRTDHAYAS